MEINEKEKVHIYIGKKNALRLRDRKKKKGITINFMVDEALEAYFNRIEAKEEQTKTETA